MGIDFAPDLVLHNGRIVTADSRGAIVDALALYGGKVVARGSSSGILASAGRGTRRVDLRGRCVVPGQIDGHVHMLFAGLDLLGAGPKVSIANLESIAEITKAIQERAQVTPPGEWIVTSCMYRGALKEGRFPNRHDLDQVAPRHPVYIFQSGKNIIANSFALQLAGIDRSTPNPAEPEGWIVRDEDGEPTGHLITGAGDLARRRWWQRLNLPVKKWDLLYFDQETQLQALLTQQRIYHACGVVGVREMGTPADELATFIEAHRRGLLKIRTDLILGLPARYLSIGEIGAALSGYFGPKQQLGDTMLRVGGIKLVIANDGWRAYGPEKLEYLIHEYNRRGWTMAIHINTGGADAEITETVLSLLEAADRERPLAGRRCSIEHGFGLQRPEHYRRAHRLGLILNANPLIAYFAAARSLHMHGVMESVRLAKRAARDPWQRTVAEWGLPLRDWLGAGLMVTGGTDNPAAVYDPEHPFLAQYSALTGDTLAGVLLPGQAITRTEMLRMFTINNAYASFQEQVRGSLEVGKLADLAVLDRDVLTCPDAEIRDLRVLQTYVGGEVVYERGA